MVESKEKENREGHDQAMGKLCDLHVHLDFMSNGSEVAEAVARHGSMLFANTVSPNGFEPAMKRFGGIPNVGVGLGFHPWWVGSSDVDAELEIFDANIGRTRFIGEVGLDYGKRAAFSKEQQVRAFRHMVGLAAESGGKVL
ncbi:MAG: TatD family hydrolase [Coriobacteriales bacterium]|jgi:TatD DNase family protein